MTNKSIRQLFVERLENVGITLTGYDPDMPTALTDEQFAELDAALNDIEQAARTDERSLFCEIAAAGENEVWSPDERADLLRKSLDHPVRMTPGAVDQFVDALKDQGKIEQRRAGLNDAGELPTLDLGEVNAVDIRIDGTRNVFVDVDGQTRFGAGNVNRLIVMAGGNRYVVLRDGSPVEALPNTPEPDTNDGLDV